MIDMVPVVLQEIEFRLCQLCRQRCCIGFTLQNVDRAIVNLHSGIANPLIPHSSNFAVIDCDDALSPFQVTLKRTIVNIGSRQRQHLSCDGCVSLAICRALIQLFLLAD
jgi:hypothetical protein